MPSTLFDRYQDGKLRPEGTQISTSKLDPNLVIEKLDQVSVNFDCAAKTNIALGLVGFLLINIEPANTVISTLMIKQSLREVFAALYQSRLDGFTEQGCCFVPKQT